MLTLYIVGQLKFFNSVCFGCDFVGDKIAKCPRVSYIPTRLQEIAKCIRIHRAAWPRAYWNFFPPWNFSLAYIRSCDSYTKIICWRCLCVHLPSISQTRRAETEPSQVSSRICERMSSAPTAIGSFFHSPKNAMFVLQRVLPTSIYSEMFALIVLSRWSTIIASQTVVLAGGAQEIFSSSSEHNPTRAQRPSDWKAIGLINVSGEERRA